MGKIFHHTPLLPHTAWPGGYGILYLVTTNSRSAFTACPRCATEELHKSRSPEEKGFPETASSVEGFVHWEGPPETCENCNKEFVSEYGDPDDPENDNDQLTTLET
jgi:hypothetical protein